MKSIYVLNVFKIVALYTYENQTSGSTEQPHPSWTAGVCRFSFCVKDFGLGGQTLAEGKEHGFLKSDLDSNLKTYLVLL